MGLCLIRLRRSGRNAALYRQYYVMHPEDHILVVLTQGREMEYLVGPITQSPQEYKRWFKALADYPPQYHLVFKLKQNTNEFPVQHVQQPQVAFLSAGDA